MSKYNLSDILNEYVGGGRIGTLKISFKDLQDKMDDLEKSGKVIVREKGSSADGKVFKEFEVVDRDSAVPGGNKQERGFTVYDYKFGFDPSDEDYFMNEYPFSIGGNDLKLAMELIDGVEGFRIREEEEPIKKENMSKKDSLKKEMMIHVNQLIDGNIDMNDFMNVVEDVMAEVNSLKESTGPSDKAETEDDVVNIDKVAGPSAKGVGYDAETSANTAEDDQEDKEIENPRPMYENGDTSDFTSELKEDDIEENDQKRYEDAAAKMIKDRILKDVPMDIIVDFVKTHGSDIRKMNNSEIKDEFEEFRSVNYDYIDENLKEHFGRFMKDYQ